MYSSLMIDVTLVAMTQHPVQEFAETPDARCQQRTAI